ncbi:MAG: NAD(P)H-hydrate dehydratase [Chloroflexi bacterium]|nr:NAD(P)H-hydrate dehydratase [Chloroflexota bacterium]
MAMQLVTTEEMRALEQGSVEHGVSLEALMDNAGLAVAEHICRLHPATGSALVLVGPGNNGGDGLVCAQHLHAWGWTVHLHLVSQKPRDTSRFPVLNAIPPGPVPAKPVDVVVDALLGTGNTRPLSGEVGAAVDAVRALQPNAAVVAVDVPSGVNADTGAADPKTLPARLTVTLGLAKTGLYQYPAQELAGEIAVADIAIPPMLLEPARTWLSDADMIRPFLPARPVTGHKGTFGKLLVVAGCASYTGAPYLTSVSAARIGAGLVRIATARSVHAIIAGKFAEATFTRLPETDDGAISREALPRLLELLNDDFDCLLIGPGLSQDWETRDVVDELLLGGHELPPRVVIDADGLNNIATQPDWHRRLPHGCVLTPHPAELGRLANLSIHEVLESRFELARDKATEWGQVVVAKGANAIVAAPDGRVVIDPGANPLLGTAGTGDVLAGAIAGLLTQGAEAWEGAVAATRVCSVAVDRLAPAYGRAGMLAGDLHAEIPRALAALSL